MTIHLLTGFLGSGKTTAIHQACKLLMADGISVAVITNDQGIKLVDNGFFSSEQIPGRQVTNGCFCCNYNELDKNIDALINEVKPGVIFAESVGSCTDIIATVMKPLLKFRPALKVTVSTFADIRLLHLMLKPGGSIFDETVDYIYRKQLEEGEIIVINKTDLSDSHQVADVDAWVKEKYPEKQLIFQDSRNEVHVRNWLHALADYSNQQIPRSLSIDYDIYGAGEAKLAWFDQELEIFSSNNEAGTNTLIFIKELQDAIRHRGFPIGHLKFLIDGKYKISHTALFDADVNDRISLPSSGKVNLLVNARIETAPETLHQLVNSVIASVESLRDCKILESSLSAFQPGYPTPTHRITEASI